MKTILHLIDTTGPGGAETVFIDLISRLPKDKYRAVVVIRDRGWVYDELHRRGIKPVLIDCKGSFNWRFLVKLWQLIKQKQVDLIQSHLLGSNIYASLAGLISRVPVVSIFHGIVDVGENERFKGLKFGAINLGSRQVVAVSNSLRKDIINRTSIKTSKLAVIYNGIAIEEFQILHHDALRKRFGWKEKVIIVGSLGNVRTAKGYDILLYAAALLRKKSALFRFVIAGQGKGGLYEKLLKLRHDLGLDDYVQFLGFNNNPAKFLAGLDVFLLSSTTEGFSIATIQAMASKLPVIVTKSGGPEEIVTHRKNGWLVEAGNSEAIVNALVNLSSHPELCERMAENAYKHAQRRFDIDSMVGSYQSIYDALFVKL